MALQEEHYHQGYRSSSVVFGCGDGDADLTSAASGGMGMERHDRPSQQPKHKKMPQRGLGVAQLERIRLEERLLKNTATTAFAAASSPPFDLSPGPATPLPHLPRASAPFAARWSDLNSPVAPSLLMPCNPFPEFSVPLPPLPPHGSITTPCASSTGHGFLHVPLQPPFEISHQDMEAGAEIFPFPTPLQNSLSNATSSQSPGAPKGRHQEQLHDHEQHPPTPPVLLPVSPFSPGVKKLQTEPPSNQTDTSDHHGTPKDEKMVGVKRPRPFPSPFDLLPLAGCIHLPWSNLPPPMTSTFHGADEYSCTAGDALFECKPARVTNLREGPPCPGGGTFQLDWRRLFEPGRREKNSKESTGPAYGDLLALGSPPAAPQLPVAPGSEFRQPTFAPGSPSCESSEPGSVPYHGGGDEVALRLEGSSRSSEKPPAFYSFLPMSPINREPISMERGHEVVDNLDLSLKL